MMDAHGHGTAEERFSASPAELKILAAIEPALLALGFVVAHLEVLPGSRGGRATLRIFLDRADPSTGNITIDDCALASRNLDPVIDVAGVIPGAYVLEVSSPGLDRPLGRRSDLARFVGSTVQIQCRGPVDGRRNFTGTLEGTEGSAVRVRLGPEHVATIPLSEVKRANLKYDFDA